MEKECDVSKIVQQNSLGGGFLQSREWLDFQQSVGRKVHQIENACLAANCVEHSLPVVGSYLYCPQGPVIKHETWSIEHEESVKSLIKLAKKEGIGWIRIEPATDEVLEFLEKATSEKIVKAPHDMQPREILAIDIAKPEEKLLSEMKSKTRYNIGIAQKRGVKIVSCSKDDMACLPLEVDFLNLTKEMALRNGISTHPENYYRKMIEALPADMLRIYAAQYDGKVIATNLMLFYGKTATYLHGASSNDHRNVMAPYLLQWQAILDAKEKGCVRYDFGGVQMHAKRTGSDLSGVTNFKLGFSQTIQPIEFPGTYDIVINHRKYAVYRGLQKAKSFAKNFRK